MSEWPQQRTAAEIVDHLIKSDYELYPSARVMMHIEDEALLARARSIILRAEVADGNLQWALQRVAQRPYQDHVLSLPPDALRAHREVYVSVIRQLVALGVVRDIGSTQGSSIFV